MKRIIIRVQWIDLSWWVIANGLLAKRRRQVDALSHARNLMREHVQAGGRVEIVVHRADGTISPKGGTYPRSSDPRRSKG